MSNHVKISFLMDALSDNLVLTPLLPVALGEQVDPSPGLLAEDSRLETERNQQAMVLEWNAREDRCGRSHRTDGNPGIGRLN